MPHDRSSDRNVHKPSLHSLVGVALAPFLAGSSWDHAFVHRVAGLFFAGCYPSKIIYHPTQYCEPRSAMTNATCTISDTAATEAMHLKVQTKMNPASEQEWLEALNGRANKVGY